MAWHDGLVHGSIHRHGGESLVRGVRCLHEDGRRNHRGHVLALHERCSVLHGGVLHGRCSVLHGGARVRCSVLHGEARVRCSVLHGRLDDGIESSRTTCVRICRRYGSLGSGALGR